MTTPEGGSGLGVGVELKDARIRRGRSLSQAQHGTRIARQYLEALEEERWSDLPAAPFARGFLSSYAQYLGLDPQEMLDRCPIPATAPGESLRQTPPPSAPDPADPSGGAVRTESGQIRAPRASLGPWIAAAVVVLVVIVGVVALVSLREDVAPQEPTRTVPGIGSLTAVEEEAQAAIADTEVSSDPLPDLRAYSARDAVSYVQLSGAPFVVIGVYDDSAAGTVIEHTPPPGSTLSADQAVTLVVSRGPRPGTTPANADTGPATDDGDGDGAQ